MNPSDFASYAFRELSQQETADFSRQYEGVDMAKLMGANEDLFPFLIQDSGSEFTVMWWSKVDGMKTILDEDPVRVHATVAYLQEHAYPVFQNLDEAKQWAIDHDWPRQSEKDPGKA